MNHTGDTGLASKYSWFVHN